MRSKIVIQKPTDTSVGLIGVDSLLEVYDNTKSGDLVVVYPGTYDLGANGIKLKDGVNFLFMPGVVINSTNPNGAFYDDGVEVHCTIQGSPKIINGAGAAINLTNLSSSCPLNNKNLTVHNLPNPVLFNEGDIVTVEGGATYKHNGSDWVIFRTLEYGDSLYRIIHATGTPSENGTALEAAYSELVNIATEGDLGENNKAALILAPGTYNLTQQWNIIAPFVDIISLTGEADVIITGFPINVDCTDVTIKGLYVDLPLPSHISHIKHTTNAQRVNFIKCKTNGTFCGNNVSVSANPSSMDIPASFYFEDCEGQGECSFGFYSNVSGKFVRCLGGMYSFGTEGIVTQDAYFEECVAININNDSLVTGFGGNGMMVQPGEFHGTAIRCKAGMYSFGTDSIAGVGASAKLIDITFSPYTIIYADLNGTFINCNFLFEQVGNGNLQGRFKGTFINCKFDFPITYEDRGISGKFFNCKDSNGNVLNTNSYLCVAAYVSIPTGDPSIEKSITVKRLAESEFDVVTSFNGDDEFHYMIRPENELFNLPGKTVVTVFRESAFSLYAPVDFLVHDYMTIKLPGSNSGAAVNYIIEYKIYPDTLFS